MITNMPADGHLIPIIQSCQDKLVIKHPSAGVQVMHPSFFTFICMIPIDCIITLMVGPEFFYDLKQADCSIETLSVCSIRVFDHIRTSFKTGNHTLNKIFIKQLKATHNGVNHKHNECIMGFFKYAHALCILPVKKYFVSNFSR